MEILKIILNIVTWIIMIALMGWFLLGTFLIAMDLSKILDKLAG